MPLRNKIVFSDCYIVSYKSLIQEVMKQYVAIIIGFGKAGKTLAAELSNRGWQVAIVERSNMMYGGSCPNVACIPTKTLVHEAEVSALLYHDDFPKQANMYKQAIGRKNRLTSFLRMIITKD